MNLRRGRQLRDVSLHIMGRPKEAVAMHGKAIRLNPMPPDSVSCILSHQVLDDGAI
jgi:hypothetical protein